MRNLNGKVSVVTGGGSGIGRALCLRLADEGGTVAVCDIRKENADDVVEEALRRGGRATSHQVDVAAERSVRDLVSDVLGHHGAVDIVINNAGVGAAPTPSDADDLIAFRQIIDINMWGVIHGSLLFLPHLLERPQANLVNITSYTALIGVPMMASYNTSKFGARGFTESLRMELTGSPVTVSLVCPGVTRTTLGLNIPGQSAARAREIQATLANGVDPDKVAAKIVRGIQRNSGRVLTGTDTRAVDVITRLSPSLHTKLMAAPMRRVIRKALT